ncbi:TLD-domain-containing protein [Flammula alnicola]|nr:TLD-domain-containing protein [Flammula alnicola]
MLRSGCLVFCVGGVAGSWARAGDESTRSEARARVDLLSGCGRTLVCGTRPTRAPTRSAHLHPLQRLRSSSPSSAGSGFYLSPSSSLSFPSSSSSAFSPSNANTMGLTYGSSPFAPHVYVPPSGAPGYAGEGYVGWDKGYSEELEREMRGGAPGAAGAAEGKGSKSPAPGPGRQAGTGASASASASVRGSPSGLGAGQRHERARTVPGSMRASPEKENEETKGGGGGWGGGFGFGFGSVRGKSYMRAGAGAGTVASSGNGDKARAGGESRSPAGSDRSGSIHGHERESITDGYEDGSARNVSMGRKGRVDDNGSTGGGGIGAFIERKSGKVELVGRREASTPVLTAELAENLRPYMPALARLPKSWTLILLPRPARDIPEHPVHPVRGPRDAQACARGADGEHTSMLLVVKDAEGAVFGVWLAEGVRFNKGGRGYFGGGESFLWKYVHDTLKVFKCTGKNNYVALCEPGYISFGGGDGHYGLYLDDTLFDGSSAPCPTFDNEPLCSPARERVRQLRSSVWGWRCGVWIQVDPRGWICI